MLGELDGWLFDLVFFYLSSAGLGMHHWPSLGNLHIREGWGAIELGMTEGEWELWMNSICETTRGRWRIVTLVDVTRQSLDWGAGWEEVVIVGWMKWEIHFLTQSFLSVLWRFFLPVVCFAKVCKFDIWIRIELQSYRGVSHIGCETLPCW